MWSASSSGKDIRRSKVSIRFHSNYPWYSHQILSSRYTSPIMLASLNLNVILVFMTVIRIDGLRIRMHGTLSSLIFVSFSILAKSINCFGFTGFSSVKQIISPRTRLKPVLDTLIIKILSPVSVLCLVQRRCFQEQIPVEGIQQITYWALLRIWWTNISDENNCSCINPREGGLLQLLTSKHI